MFNAIKREIEYRRMKKDLKKKETSLEFNFNELSKIMLQSPVLMVADKKI